MDVFGFRGLAFRGRRSTSFGSNASPGRRGATLVIPVFAFVIRVLGPSRRGRGVTRRCRLRVDRADTVAFRRARVSGGVANLRLGKRVARNPLSKLRVDGDGRRGGWRWRWAWRARGPAGTRLGPEAHPRSAARTADGVSWSTRGSSRAARAGPTPSCPPSLRGKEGCGAGATVIVCGTDGAPPVVVRRVVRGASGGVGEVAPTRQRRTEGSPSS